MSRDTEATVRELIGLLLAKSKTLLSPVGQDALALVDPIDGEEVLAHYGSTHLAAACLILGGEHSETGERLLRRVLDKWDDSKRQPGFHNDFNHFALCLCEPHVSSPAMRQQVRDAVLGTPDSNHDTVNWLPMRWYVNRQRHAWTGDATYAARAERCRSAIGRATNADGGVEDRLPKGVSFNLQYDISTVAACQLLRVEGENMDLSRQLAFLLRAALPDGDINYQGRGTNQIFAWGPWLYLLLASGQEDAAARALGYLVPRLRGMTARDNLMLNEWEGRERLLWWDYHHFSVYMAHCLLWLVLALRDRGKAPVTPADNTSGDTGLHLLGNGEWGVHWFEGRREYLAEYGPSVAAVWTRERGVLFRGTFGPFRGSFGNRHAFEPVVLRNFLGLVETGERPHPLARRIGRRLLHSWRPAAETRLRPLFCPVGAEERDGALRITWTRESSAPAFLNLPTLAEGLRPKLTVDGAAVPLCLTGRMRNQYGWVNLYESHTHSGREWALSIK